MDHLLQWLSKCGPRMMLQPQPGILFFFFLIYLFIFGCAGSSLLRTGFLQLQRAGATLRCGARASHCGGFSCCRARALGMRVSVIVAHRLSSCGAWAQLLRGMWDLPGPGLEPVSPALAGRFLTTVPRGKSQPGILQKCKSPGPLLGLLNQKLSGGPSNEPSR